MLIAERHHQRWLIDINRDIVKVPILLSNAPLVECTMSIDLFPSDLRRFIEDQISAGEFSSVDEFAVAAAELYRQSQEKHSRLRNRVGAAVAQIDSGQATDISDPVASERLREKIKADGRSRLAGGE